MLPTPITAAVLVLALGLGPAEGPEAPPADAESPGQPEAEAPEPGPDGDADVEQPERPEPTPADGKGEPESEGEPEPSDGVETPSDQPEPEPELEPEAEPEPEPQPTPDLRPEPVPMDEPEPELEELVEDYDPTRHSPEAIRARNWLRSGIVATSAGVVLGVVAVVMGTLDPCAPKGGNNCFVDARNRAALASGIPGALLLTGGVAMISVGSVRLKRIRAGVDLSRGRVGFSFGARF